MSIKSILCVSDGTPDEIASLNASLALAKANDAKLRILHITPQITPYVEGIIANSVITDSIEEENEERLGMAHNLAEHYAALYHVPLDAKEPPQNSASAQFVHSTGREDEVLSKEGHLSDLVVVSRDMNGMNILYDTTLVTALFETGRPALVVPRVTGPTPREWDFKTVVLAWSGSIEGVRALHSAMPILEKAEKVHVLVAHNHKDTTPVTEHGDVMEYLNSHNITADIIMIDRGRHSAGEALLSKAHELKSDLIVMGAYSHSRVREMILGGVTHFMLKNADIPLFLSH